MLASLMLRSDPEVRYHTRSKIGRLFPAYSWLFAGSDEGGKTAATLMSLCATCKELGIDPFAYLRDVLIRVSTHPASRIEELLPDRWKAAESADPPDRKG
jgi:hypothetical protein